MLSSCYVQQPKYSSIEKFSRLETGLELDSVNSILGVKPHDLIALEEDGTSIWLYKYRVKEMRRIPMLMRKNKGLEVDGKWKDLIVMFSPEGKVIRYETRIEELKSELEKRSIDPNKVIQSITLALTVVLPALLVFFSAK